MSSTDFEAALITAIVDQKAMKDALAMKVTVEHFNTTTGKACFLHLLKWYKNPAYLDTPSWESFSATFPTFVPVRVDESISTLSDILREGLVYSDLASLVSDIGNLAEDDPMEALRLVQAASSKLSSKHVVDDSLSMHTLIPDLVDSYYRMKESPTALLGLPYMHAPLNRALLGAQDGQFIVVMARPKSGKTTFALAQVTEWIKLGHKGLIISQEMQPPEVVQTIACCFCKVPEALVATGGLTPQMEADFLDNLEALMELEMPKIARIYSIGENAVEEVAAMIDQEKPKWVLVDGVYLLGNNDWKVIADVTKGLKRVASKSEVVMLGTTQRKRPEAKDKKGKDIDGADDFAGSDTFAQDCDVAIRLTATAEERSNHVNNVTLAAARKSYASAKYTMHWQPCHDFSVAEDMSDTEETTAPAPGDGGDDNFAGET